MTEKLENLLNLVLGSIERLEERLDTDNSSSSSPWNISKIKMNLPEELTLDKSQASFNDLLDALMLSLRAYDIK